MTMTYRDVKDTSGVFYSMLECQTCSAPAAYVEADPGDLQAQLSGTFQQLAHRRQSGSELWTESEQGF